MFPSTDHRGRIRPTGVGVYVHVPWCSFKCDYCAFYSQPLRDASLAARFVDKTLELLERRLAVLFYPTVDTIYVGGGTPTLLPVGELRRLLDGVAALCGEAVIESTVEANPDTIDDRLLATLADSGVTRLSVGVQSFQPRLLQQLGRNCRNRDVEVVLQRVAHDWGGQWSIDLIAGILDQSVLEGLDDVERACGFAPDHLSLYDLSIEDGTSLARRLGLTAARPNPDRAAEVSAAAVRAAEDHGYHRYEVSNFCRSGARSHHNLGYWMMRDYIGVGPSAVSAVSHDDGSVTRYSDAADIAQFLNATTAWGDAQLVDGQSAAFERLMVGLRLDSGVDLAEVLSRLDAQHAEAFSGVIQSWIERGDARLSDRRLRMTPRGWDRLDFCLRELGCNRLS